MFVTCISQKIRYVVSSICSTLPQAGKHIPQPLTYQWWITGWDEENTKSERWFDPANQAPQTCALPTELDLGPIYSRRKKGNVSFNDALNIFYLLLYGVRHMVKDHSDRERGNPLLPHGLLVLINSKGYFVCIIQHSLWYTSRGALAGTITIYSCHLINTHKH